MKKVKKKKAASASPPSPQDVIDAVQAAKDDLDAALDAYIAALESGVLSDIRAARRLVCLALAALEAAEADAAITDFGE